jgi:putative acetyltransferase
VTKLDGVEFRRAAPADAEGLARLLGLPEVLRNTLQLPLPSADAWRKRLEAQIAEPQHFHVIAANAGDVIGSAGLYPVTGSLRTRHAAGLGIGVDPAWWGRGLGTELMRRLLDWADNWAGIVRVELGVYADNERAIALYRRFGFEHEGRQRAWALREGEYVDSLMMARLHPHPPQLPAAAA